MNDNLKYELLNYGFKRHLISLLEKSKKYYGFLANLNKKLLELEREYSVDLHINLLDSLKEAKSSDIKYIENEVDVLVEMAEDLDYFYGCFLGSYKELSDEELEDEAKGFEREIRNSRLDLLDLVSNDKISPIDNSLKVCLAIAKRFKIEAEKKKRGNSSVQDIVNVILEII